MHINKKNTCSYCNPSFKDLDLIFNNNDIQKDNLSFNKTIILEEQDGNSQEETIFNNIILKNKAKNKSKIKNKKKIIFEFIKMEKKRKVKRDFQKWEKFQKIKEEKAQKENTMINSGKIIFIKKLKFII